MLKYKNIILAMCINSIEAYNVALFAFFIPVLAPLFFPAETIELSLARASFAFSFSFFMRPFGGIFFGQYGDRFGRQKAIVLSILLMSLSTFIIGFLPINTGYFVSILIALCLSIQGLCAGGAYSGAAVFINEHSKDNNRGFMASLLGTSGIIGMLMVSGIGIFITSQLFSQNDPRSWRIAFLLGGFFGIIIYLIRGQLDETPEFKKHNKSTLKNMSPLAPFLSIMKNRKTNLIHAIFLGAFAFMPFYTIYIFMNNALASELRLSCHYIFKHNLMLSIMYIIFLPITGFIADKLGVRRIMLWGASTTMLLVVPLFWILEAYKFYYILIFSQIILIIAHACFLGPLNAFIPNLFPVSERLSGHSFGFFTGAAIFGGTCIGVEFYLYHHYDSIIYSAFYVCFISLLACFTMLKSTLYSEKLHTK